LSNILILVGRMLLSAIFLHEAWMKFFAYGPAQAYMQAFGVPGELLPFAIATEAGAGLLVLVGLWTRVASVLLAGFCLVAAAVFHHRFGDLNQLLHFEKNLAIAGGFLTLAAFGPGGWSLDAVRRRSP
jgi:putative oxidoreductase